jgi:UDP-N-acetylmuramate dehydrogenase
MTVLWTLDQGFAGLENLSLIPGSVKARPDSEHRRIRRGNTAFFHELSTLILPWSTRFDAMACRFAYREASQNELKDRVSSQVTFVCHA